MIPPHSFPDIRGRVSASRWRLLSLRFRRSYAVEPIGTVSRDSDLCASLGLRPTFLFTNTLVRRNPCLGNTRLPRAVCPVVRIFNDTCVAVARGRSYDFMLDSRIFARSGCYSTSNRRSGETRYRPAGSNAV